MTEARMIFEGLARQSEIWRVAGRGVKIKTPTIPTKIDQKRLAEIETDYARRLLTPLSQVGIDASASHLTLVPSPLALAKRRVPRSSSDLTPFQTFIGCAGNDEELQAIFTQYGYLTVAMVALLLQKSENTSRNKLKRLDYAVILETQNVPRTTPSCNTAPVYTLAENEVHKPQYPQH